MKKVFFYLILFSILGISHFFFTETVVNADDIVVPLTQDKGLGVIAGLGGDSKDLVGNIFKNVITLFFAVGGIGFTIMIVWGAVDWILSGGDKEKVAGARKRITQAIIGLVILSLLFAIMVVAGQITGIDALKTGVFLIPNLSDKPNL